MASKERWLPVVGFEGRYEVSDRGRVRSLDRIIVRRASKRARAYAVRKKGKILRPGQYCKNGHVSVVLGRVPDGCNNVGMPVHKLVMRAFKGPPRKGQEILHRNGKPTDNRLTNLRYGTRSQNNRDIVLHGRRRVSVQDIKDIRRLAKAGVTQRELSAEFGVCRSQISNIANKRHYAHV